MASEEQKQLANAIKPLMRSAGFKRSSFNWHRKSEGVVQVLNFQGSQWSKFVYVNLGIYFSELGSKENPREYECHIRERLSAVAPDLAQCNRLFDLENDIAFEQRCDEVTKLIQDVALQWLDRCSTKPGAKSYLKYEKRHGLPVTAQAKSYLGL